MKYRSTELMHRQESLTHYSYLYTKSHFINETFGSCLWKDDSIVCCLLHTFSFIAITIGRKRKCITCQRGRDATVDKVMSRQCDTCFEHLFPKSKNMCVLGPSEKATAGCRRQWLDAEKNYQLLVKKGFPKQCHHRRKLTGSQGERAR